MNIDALQGLLDAVAAGTTPVAEAINKLKHLAFENLNYAHIDHHRSLRKGFPEVIFGEGKSSDQICGIMQKMTTQEYVVLVTRVDSQKAADVLTRFPKAVYHKDARMIIHQKLAPPKWAEGRFLS